MVGKKGLFELKKCTVSGLKRQFDKWHLFSAPTGGGIAPPLHMLSKGETLRKGGGGIAPNWLC